MVTPRSLQALPLVLHPCNTPEMILGNLTVPGFESRSAACNTRALPTLLSFNSRFLFDSKATSVDLSQAVGRPKPRDPWQDCGWERSSFVEALMDKDSPSVSVCIGPCSCPEWPEQDKIQLFKQRGSRRIHSFLSSYFSGDFLGENLS